MTWGFQSPPVVGFGVFVPPEPQQLNFGSWQPDISATVLSTTNFSSIQVKSTPSRTSRGRRSSRSKELAGRRSRAKGSR